MGTTKLAQLALKHKDELAAMLYMAAYGFMMRAPSELLPTTTCRNGDAGKPPLAGARSCLSLCGTELVLKLAHRRSKARG